MLDALLKSKFYSRCKSEIKLTKKRIEIIKRKRTAMQKFLRHDIAVLLEDGLDSNAYARVERLYADQNLSSCYEFVEQSCNLILSHLSVMEKLRECPDECKEAISTMMFAAARFADMPELRELRSLFSDRYGNYLEPYVNQEFIKNLKADLPTKEIKLQTMHAIAVECGINWDSKSLEQKPYKPPPFVEDWSQYAKERNSESLQTNHQNGLETKFQETDDKHSNKQTEVAKKDHTIENGLPYKSRGEFEKKEEKHKNLAFRNDLPYKSRAEFEKKEEEHKDQTVGKSLSYKSRAGFVMKEEEHKDQTVGNGLASNLRAGFETKEENHKNQTVGNRLPYKSRAGIEKKKEEEHGYDRASSYWSSDASSCSESSTTSPEYSTGPDDSASEDISPEGRKFYVFGSMAPPYIKPDLTKKTTNSYTISGSGSKCKNDDLESASEDIIPEERKFYGFRSMAPPYTKPDLSKKVTNSDTSSDSGKQEESANMTKSVPRSMRIRRPLKPAVSGSHGNNEVSKPSPKFSNGDHDHDHNDEELKKTSKLGCDSDREVGATTRTCSLPHESLGTRVATDERKGLARAATYQADSGLSPRGHVHPKLPDYDDFVARLAALRASS